MRLRYTSVLLLIAAAASATSIVASGAPQSAAKDKPQSAPSIAELWSEPEPGRDLYWGVGGKRLAPDPNDTYTVLEIKIRGFSEGYTVADSEEGEWSVKMPPEASSEIVASRLHWAVGFHQPPSYIVREWSARGARSPNPQLPARFREKDPDLHGLTGGDSWSFKSNPFVGTRELNGLLVLQAIIENPDTKPSNNTIYTLTSEFEGARRWYVVRDLGYSFGRTGYNSPRNDIEAFERAPFIKEVRDGEVKFFYSGMNRSLMNHIRVEDVHWICRRLAALTDQQWQDAFRAGAYEASEANRFIAVLKKRVREGLALGEPK